MKMVKHFELLWIIYFPFLLKYTVSKEDIRNCTFGVNYTGSVNILQSYKFIFNYTETKNAIQAFRIKASTVEAPNSYPVLLVVRQQRNVQSFQLPVIIKNGITPYQHLSRTLCPVEKSMKSHDPDENVQFITVDISSDVAATKSTAFTLQTQMLADFALRLGELHSVQVTPTEPQYFLFTFPPGVESVDVRVNSSDGLCAIFSIQDVHCPVYDEVRDVQFKGSFQTITTSGTITAESQNYDGGSFYVVLIVKPDNEDCSNMRTLSPSTLMDPSPTRNKNIGIFIARSLSMTEYIMPVVTAVAFFSLFYVAAFILMFVYHCWERRQGDPFPEAGSLISNTTYEERQVMPPPSTSYGATLSTEGGDLRRQLEYSLNDQFVTAASHTGKQVRDENAPMGTSSSLPHHKVHLRHIATQYSSSHSINTGGESSHQEDEEEGDIDMLHDASTDVDVVAMNRVLYVTDLSRKKSNSLQKKYILYHWYIIIIGVFYGLPVIQLVLTYQWALRTSGNQDMCYYNFDCARPFKVFTAFNNVFSNIGYVMLGLLFFLLTWRRAILHRRECAANPALGKSDDGTTRLYGLPQHFGLFYSMGIALTVEGLMSGCYHVCPSYNNFQFDTAFMYILASLTMLKIYQNRHPDINAPAHIAYMLMAVIILIGVFGVILSPSITFWIVITLCFLVFSIMLTIEVYYLGRWRLDRSIPRRIYILIRNEGFHCLRPLHPDRMVFILIVNVANWALAFYGLLKQPADFPSFLLSIFMGNLLLYYFFYIIMKLKHHERIHAFPCCYIALSFASWGAAIYFFLRHSNSWEMTPAQSRSMNKPCLMFNFYDEHDIWHFLSALSMFFSFMSLLSLDDDLYFTPRDKIPVF